MRTFVILLICSVVPSLAQPGTWLGTPFVDLRAPYVETPSVHNRLLVVTGAVDAALQTVTFTSRKLGKQLLVVKYDHHIASFEPNTEYTTYKTDNGSCGVIWYDGSHRDFGDTAREVVVLSRDRYMIYTNRYRNYYLVDSNGNALRPFVYSSPRHTYPRVRLFVTDAGWSDDEGKLLELNTFEGKRLTEFVFHDIYVDWQSLDSFRLRRGNDILVLSPSGDTLRTSKVHEIGQPCPYPLLAGRLIWGSGRDHGYDYFFDQEEPPWTVDTTQDKKALDDLDGAIELSLDTTTTDLFAGKFKAGRLTLYNASGHAIRLNAFAGLFPVEYEVRTDTAWHEVLQDLRGYCGNSGGFADLAAGESVSILIPLFTGDQRTEFRCTTAYRMRNGSKGSTTLTFPGWIGALNNESWHESEFRFGDLSQRSEPIPSPPLTR